MNIKKALKRLNRADVLVTRVLDQLGNKQAQVRGLLSTAKESLDRAQAAIGVRDSADAKEVPAKTGQNPSPRSDMPAKKPATPAKGIAAKSKRLALASKNVTRRRPIAHRAVLKKSERQPARVPLSANVR